MSQRFAYQDAVVAGMKALGGVHLSVLRSGLPRTLIDLVYFRASQINGCSYCIDVPEAEYQAALTEFDETQLAHLTLAIGVINTYNRMAVSFRRGPEPPSSPIEGQSLPMVHDTAE